MHSFALGAWVKQVYEKIRRKLVCLTCVAGVHLNAKTRNETLSECEKIRSRGGRGGAKETIPFPHAPHSLLSYPLPCYPYVFAEPRRARLLARSLCVGNGTETSATKANLSQKLWNNTVSNLCELFKIYNLFKVW